jgi:hypothetical protein
LADVCAPGFDRDGLTGSLTRRRLRERVNKATFGSSWTDRTRYRERFLINRWIEMHLNAGVLAAKPGGARIECGDPIWLDQA